MESGKVAVEPTDKRLKANGVGKYRVQNMPAEVNGNGTNGRDSVPVDPEDPSTWTQAEARRQKEVELALRRRREREIEEGRFVEREKADFTIRQMAARFREGLLSWPGRVAAEMAADLGVTPEELGPVMEVYVRDFLAEISEGELDDA